MKSKVVVLYLSAVLAFSNNSIIASKDNISNGNDQPTNTNKSEDYEKSTDDADKLQSKKDSTFGVEENDKSQKKLAEQTSQQKNSFNLNIKNFDSSFKKKLNDEKVSGDVLSVKGNLMVSFSEYITYKRTFAATLVDAHNFCDNNKIIILSGTDEWKNAGWAALSWFLSAKRKLNIYGYEITQRISPLSAKSDAGYRVNVFSFKNVFNVLNRLSYTSLNPGCMDFLNVSVMRNDAYIKDTDRKNLLEEKLGLVALGLDIFSVNKKFSNSLEIGFLIGTHYNLGGDKFFDHFIQNAALQFSLNCTCKYIFLNLKLIGYRNSNDMMCKKDNNNNNNKIPLNIYLDYTDTTLEDIYIVPVKIKLGSSILKGKKMAAWGRNSLIFKDICLDIKSNIFFHKSLAVLLSYDLSLNFSLDEKYIDIALGICSNDKGLKMYGDEVNGLMKVDNVASEYSEYDDNSAWIYFPILYLKIQINWLELRK